jgi:hypothetical protein
VIIWRWNPGRRAVTHGAILGESGGYMAGIACLVELSLMAGNAGCPQSRILTAAMAIRTLKAFMGARQRKLRRCVIIWRWNPGRRAVTHGAILGESGSYMAGIGCLIELSLMAGNAGCPQSRILTARVAIQALKALMGPGELKLGRAVAVKCALPCCRRMAWGAISRVSGPDMVRIGRAVVILEMAADAVCG